MSQSIGQQQQNGPTEDEQLQHFSPHSSSPSSLTASADSGITTTSSSYHSQRIIDMGEHNNNKNNKKVMDKEELRILRWKNIEYKTKLLQADNKVLRLEKEVEQERNKTLMEKLARKEEKEATHNQQQMEELIKANCEQFLQKIEHKIEVEMANCECQLRLRCEQTLEKHQQNSEEMLLKRLEKLKRDALSHHQMMDLQLLDLLEEKEKANCSTSSAPPPAKKLHRDEQAENKQQNSKLLTGVQMKLEQQSMQIKAMATKEQMQAQLLVLMQLAQTQETEVEEKYCTLKEQVTALKQELDKRLDQTAESLKDWVTIGARLENVVLMKISGSHFVSITPTAMRAKRPFPSILSDGLPGRRLFYFETLVSNRHPVGMQIGLSVPNFASNNLKFAVSNYGNCCVSGKELKRYRQHGFNTGDVVGCGLLILSESSRHLFFTINGLILIKPIPLTTDELGTEELYPTVMAWESPQVVTNTGENLMQMPFLFADLNTFKLCCL